MDKMPCLRAYAPSGIRTHGPLITSREHEPLHYSAPNEKRRKVKSERAREREIGIENIIQKANFRHPPPPPPKKKHTLYSGKTIFRQAMEQIFGQETSASLTKLVLCAYLIRGNKWLRYYVLIKFLRPKIGYIV